MNLGIFGGTFNPIHWGHLVLAETAREQLSLDRLLFIPTFRPPHKPAEALLPGRARLVLITLAIRGNPAFAASDLELRRRGVSYSIETVRTLRAQYPRAALFLVIGADMAAVRWRAWDELTRLCTIVVAGRPQVAALARARGFTPTPKSLVWGFTRLSMPLLEVSSSEIRHRLRAGRSIRYLVPPAVERYIRQHRLYRSIGH